jgi:predicted Rossmann fold flavoprotein
MSGTPATVETPSFVDTLVLGAGGAGMMCAIQAGRRGRSVRLVDHAAKIGGKILISGGGRCNFTNLGTGPANYVSRNPHFCKSALSRFVSSDFVKMVETHGIAYHEKKLGQLFCDGSAQAIVTMMEAECRDAGADFWMGTKVEGIEKLLAEEPTDETAPRFRVLTSRGPVECRSLVVATGGLSIPKIGATGFGYDIARQFGLKLVDQVAALDGFVFNPVTHEIVPGLKSADLSGVSIDCRISCNDIAFRENILFTHAGLSGPAALQASLHWNPGDEVTIDLLPEPPQGGTLEWLLRKKKEGNRSIVRNLLSELLPSRFTDRFCDLYLPQTQQMLPLPQVSEKALEALCQRIHEWKIIPAGTVGYSKAEVTRGGVDTDELSSKTLETRKVPGLYFIGEVVDVTGWLGGYNFQWAWASGWAAGQVV